MDPGCLGTALLTLLCHLCAYSWWTRADGAGTQVAARVRSVIAGCECRLHECVMHPWLRAGARARPGAAAMWRALLLSAALGAAAAQDGTSPTLERVANNAQLASALERDVPHIVITEHLDLSNRQRDETAADKQLFRTSDKLRSITVRMPSSPPRRRVPGQPARPRP